MIKKIAVTASTMLFVLAQIFSFYVITTSRQEKIELAEQAEKQSFQRAISEFGKNYQNLKYDKSLSDYVIVQCFRNSMIEDSALYKEGKELFNNSSYEFSLITEKKQKRELDNVNCIKKKVKGSHLLIYYYFSKIEEQEYVLFHAMDITHIYDSSFRLAIKEVLISILISIGMARILVFLIQKITKPLHAINETQRQLIGSMSHELKTPLTAIKGYSETLLHVKLSQEQEQKALHYINTESARLSRLSEKMMELTELYEPECKIQMQKVRLEKLFTDVENSVRHRLEEKEIRLVWEGNIEEIYMNLDRDLMVSFLINLINNSILASLPQSSIFLGGNETSVWVRDEGCGIDKAEVDKVKKAFYRVDKSRSRKSGNMGLGLALCDQIAKIHHAHMEIESKPGEGTKVTFVYESFTKG